MADYKKKRHGETGISLVEVLVSAVLLSIAIIAIVAMIRKGWEIDTNNLHRRQARAIIVNMLERQEYQYDKYAALNTTCGAAGCRKDSALTIDAARSTLLKDTLTRQIYADNTLTIGATQVPRLIIAISLKWQELGYRDSVRIEKWITEAL